MTETCDHKRGAVFTAQWILIVSNQLRTAASRDLDSELGQIKSGRFRRRVCKSFRFRISIFGFLCAVLAIVAGVGFSSLVGLGAAGFGGSTLDLSVWGSNWLSSSWSASDLLLVTVAVSTQVFFSQYRALLGRDGRLLRLELVLGGSGGSPRLDPLTETVFWAAVF